MVNVEKLAVNAVSTAISRCDHLTDYIGTNDKTPITDGHIDFYKNKSKKKADIAGRVSVQVKGRSTPKPVKTSKREVKFGIDHDDLQFFRDSGGGIYFYVPMRPTGDSPEVFYAVLSPFKIARRLGMKTGSSASYQFIFQRLPSDCDQIEAIIKFAHHTRDQKALNAEVSTLLEEARSISIHTMDRISSDSPTTFRLDRDDVAISITTSAGLVVPIDIDIRVLPEDYTPREVPMKIQGGSILYESVLFARTSQDTLLITCSEGLNIVLTLVDGKYETNVNLKLAGSLPTRLKDINFFSALASGAPLYIDGNSSEPKHKPIATREGLDASQAVISGAVEVLKYFGLSEKTLDSLSIDEREMGDLLMLRDGLLKNIELPITGEGNGRWDFPLGRDKVIVLVGEGSSSEHKKLMDPFALSNRSSIVIAQNVDGAMEEIDWATVYDPLEIDDLVSTLNLHLDDLVLAYEKLTDERRFSLANQMVLKLISAADTCHLSDRRMMLLTGAFALNSWLIKHASNSLTNKINRWQILKRQGNFSPQDQHQLLIARRSDISGPESILLEACLAILLGYKEELSIILDELDSADRERLETWPIWHLTGRKNEVLE